MLVQLLAAAKTLAAKVGASIHPASLTACLSCFVDVDFCLEQSNSLRYLCIHNDIRQSSWSKDTSGTNLKL
jgi:hypothetical protein